MGWYGEGQAVEHKVDGVVGKVAGHDEDGRNYHRVAWSDGSQSWHAGNELRPASPRQARRGGAIPLLNLLRRLPRF